MFLFSLITQQNNAAIIFEIEYVAHMLKRAFWYIILFLSVCTETFVPDLLCGTQKD